MSRIRSEAVFSDGALPDGRVAVVLSAHAEELLGRDAAAITAYLERHPQASPAAVAATVLRTRPDLAMVYIAERLGTSQQILVDAVAGDIELAQQDGSVRPGDPRRLAAMCLLITQSAIQSARMVEPILDAEALDAELTRALDGYLKP